MHPAAEARSELHDWRVAEGTYKVRLRGVPAGGYTVEVRQGLET
jgi:hypothetical protein